jgi:prevent-host-death family protein
MEVMMKQQTINVAEAKKNLSELLGRVAYGKEEIIITKRGKPMARLAPVEEEPGHLAEAKGWLDDDDGFFEIVEHIIQDRENHIPRVMTNMREE